MLWRVLHAEKYHYVYRTSHAVYQFDHLSKEVSLKSGPIRDVNTS